MTDADLQKINKKLEKLGADVKITPKLTKSVKEMLPKGLTIELDPKLNKITEEALSKAVEGKVIKVEVSPLLTNLRKALKDATSASPAEIEVGINPATLRRTIESVLNKHGFMININTVNDNYTKVIQQNLNGKIYTVKIYADAKEIARSVQTSLTNIQSKTFGLTVAKDVLRNSIDVALAKPFPIQISVMHDQARRAVQNALNNARMVGKDDALAFQRLQTGELRAAQAELTRLKAAHQSAANAAQAHASASINLGGAMGSNIRIAGELGSAMASLYSIHAAKQFLSQVIEIGGELEHQKIALETIYGSQSKMQSLYGQIKNLARESPFGVMELTKSVKQLSAYGVAYNEVYDTAKRLADISAATSVDINRLILAYGKTKNRTFLDGLEAKQFAYANIPIYDMLSKKLTELEGKFVSVKDVMGRIKKREIGFDMVKDILWDMTDEGGKFYNMQEKLAGSVKTSWKLVRDNIELMFGEMAEGAIGSGLKSLAQLLQGLTREWRTIGLVMGTAAAGLGLYKISTLAVNSTIQKSTTATYNNIIAQKQKHAEELKAIGRLVKLNRLEQMYVATANKMTNADLRQAMAEGTLNDRHLAQLFLQKKVTAEQIKYLASIGMLDKGIAKAILSQNKFALSMQYVRTSVANAARSMGAMLFNWWTVAIVGVSALVGTITKYYEGLQRVKELTNEFHKKGFEGSENMNKQVKDLNAFDLDTASSSEINSKIEEMKTTLKDYALTANDTFRTVFGPDANGKIMSQKEQFVALKQAVIDTANAYKQMSNGTESNIFTSDSAKGAIDSGKEYEKYISKTADAYGKLIENADKIDQYINNIEVYGQKANGTIFLDSKATQDIKDYVNSLGTLEEKLEYLKTQNVTYRSLAWGENLVGKYIQYFKAQEKTLQKSQQTISEYLSFLENRKKAVDPQFNIADATREEKEKFLQEAKAFIDAQEEWGQQMKTLALDMSFEYVGIDSSRITEMFDKLFQEVSAQIGSELANKVKDGIELTDAEKSKVEQALKNAYFAMFKNAPEWQKEALNKAFAKAGSNGLLSFDSSKLARLRVRMQVEPELNDWQQEVYKKLGGEPTIKTWLKGAPDTQSFVKAAQEGYKTARDGLARLKPLALNAGLNLNFNLSKLKRIPMVTKAYADASPAIRQMIDEYNAFVDIINAASKAGKEFGFNPAEEYNKSHKSKNTGSKSTKGSQKDTIAESFRQRFKDIKDAWSEFQKWEKTEGSEAAFKRVGESGLFSTLPKDKIPKTVEQYRQLIVDLENELKNAGIKGHSQRESLWNEILKQLLDIDNTVTTGRIKNALDKVTKEAEQQVANWNLFDKIRKATGNRNLAMDVAFGMNATAETDYPTMIKNQFDELAKASGSTLTYDAVTPEILTTAPEEIRKAWEEATKKLSQYAREQKDSIESILSEYQTLQDKLTKIDADRNKKLEIVSKSSMSDSDKAKYSMLINTDADYQKFTQSNEYLRFFNDIYGLTMSEANRIGDLIQLNLNQKLQAGLITIYDYEKEMEKVRKQLESLRNVKSDALTFLTKGIKGLSDKKLKKEQGRLANDEGYQKALKEQINAQNALNKAKETGNKEAIDAAEAQLNSANEAVASYTKLRDSIIKDQERVQSMLDGINIANSIAQGVSDAFNTLRDMADSFGFDTDSNAWNTIGAVIDTMTAVTGGIQKTMQSLMNGDIGGVISGVFDTVLTPITIWNKLHDKKLQKDIELSQKQFKAYERLVTAIERKLEQHLGGFVDFDPNPGTEYGANGSYEYYREAMKGQLEELERQKSDMEAMKKKDPEAIADITEQIDEMRDKIENLNLDIANQIYGIDIKGWAESIGDALWDAFMQGKDAAEAFDKAVADIMSGVVKNILKVNILERAFQATKDWLTSETGPMQDGILNGEEAGELWRRLYSDAKDGMTSWNTAMDAMPEDMRQFLIDNYEKDSKSGLSAGIQSITEDTADLLASYVNAIRADVSMSRFNWERLLDNAIPQMNVIAESQLRAQREVAANTLRSAIAAEMIMQSNENIYRLLSRATQGGAKFYIQ